MKILMVTSSMDTGGAETHIYSLAKALMNMGHKIYVASSGGRLADELRQIGVRHVKLGLDRRYPLGLLRARFLLGGLIRKEGIDVIHAHSRLGAYVAYYAASAEGIPFVTTVHAKFTISPIRKRLSRWGNPTIAVSEDLRHYLCEGYGFCSENTRLIPNGIDTSLFFPVPSAKKNHRIVFVSRLDSDCSAAAFALCRIAPTICRQFPDTEILICGGGEEYRPLSQLKEKLGLSCVRLLGNVDRLSDILRSAGLFVGVSRAALEAMACGASVILGGNEGFIGLADSKEVLERACLTNFCCRGATRLTDEALYSEILRAFSMPRSETERISRLLSAYVRENNSLELMARQTEAVYREALASSIKKGKGQIVLLGYYGFGNLGDNALLRASIKRAKKAYGGKIISALTKSPKRDRLDFGIRCVNRYSPLSIIRELWGAEVLILGGGTLLQDSTSLRSLIYYSSVIKLAKALGLRVELWGNGLTRPRAVLAARLVKWAIANSSYVGLRDLSSASEALRLASIGDGDKLYYEKDLAADQGAAQSSRIDFLLDRLGIKNGDSIKDFAVIAVMGGVGKGYLSILRYWLEKIKSQGITLVFIPMFPAEETSECQYLCECHGGVVASSLSESDVVGLMKHCSVVCGMRLHSLVFASAANAPFVGFGGDPKIESFCRENGGVYFTELY